MRGDRGSRARRRAQHPTGVGPLLVVQDVGIVGHARGAAASSGERRQHHAIFETQVASLERLGELGKEFTCSRGWIVMTREMAWRDRRVEEGEPGGKSGRN